MEEMTEMRITLSNDFHNTRLRLALGRDQTLSARQVRRARRELCGIKGCLCGGTAGERGAQPATENGDGDGHRPYLLLIDPHQDGGAEVTFVPVR